ncbi:uncharacterized protein LOC120427710 [Culex pipiens pallens]|uniref:uncharacterized protein LOC120427710 n=1 Tax=Culex pipiens pallens TaxID=42434 RepID=UPI001952BA8F|nr:uncharacterized protein LOC120427710 [Culex pipiens pallens]
MDIMRECTANYLFRYSFKYEEFILAESGGIDRQRPSEDRIVEKIQQLKDGSRGGGWDVLAVLSDILGIKFIIVSNQQEDILIYESTAGISTQEVYLYFNGPDSYYSIVGVSDWNRDTDPRRSDATTTRTAAENSNESLGPKATANQLPYCSAVPLTISENSAAGRVDIPNTADTNKSSQGSLDRLDVGKELSCNEVHNDKEIINSEAYYQVFTSNYDHLKILRIPPDGNCLFGSIVHQLENLDIRSSGHKKSVADLSVSTSWSNTGRGTKTRLFRKQLIVRNSGRRTSLRRPSSKSKLKHSGRTALGEDRKFWLQPRICSKKDQSLHKTFTTYNFRGGWGVPRAHLENLF